MASNLAWQRTASGHVVGRTPALLRALAAYRTAGDHAMRAYHARRKADRVAALNACAAALARAGRLASARRGEEPAAELAAALAAAEARNPEGLAMHTEDLCAALGR